MYMARRSITSRSFYWFTCRDPNLLNSLYIIMGKAKKTRQFAVAKKVISPKDTRVASVAAKAEKKAVKEAAKAKPKQVDQAVSALFFQYNTQLGPPYHVLVDTNFINFSIKNKMDIVRSMMDCLLAKCIPCITDCVMG